MKKKEKSPLKAWNNPEEPENPCEACEGTGMGPHREYNGDSLVDWDDCPECQGTGEQPKSDHGL